MIDIENIDEPINSLEKRIIKMREVRKYDNEKYGMKDYYGLRDYQHLTDKELDKRLTEITIEKAQQNG